MHRRLLMPERPERSIHEAGMEQRRPLQLFCLDHATKDLAIERAHAVLFLLRFGAAAEFLGRDRFEHVHVAPTQVRVPGRRASTRDDDEASWVDAGFAQRPSDEGDPIKQLESDLTRPWTDDDRPRTLGEPLDASPDAALVDAQRL